MNETTPFFRQNYKDPPHTQGPLPQSSEVLFGNLWALVGNTPMIEIAYSRKGRVGLIYAKCEHYSLTGSIKDRIALYILQEGYASGRIRPGDIIVEATSGNTGIALSAIGRALGHEVTILMPDWMNRETKALISSYGSRVISVSGAEGGFLGSIALSEKIARENNRVFLPRQFENRFNEEAHKNTTGVEIWSQLQSAGRIPDAFVAGVGTGGTVMGVGKYLTKMNPDIHIHPLEPLESPTLTLGRKVGSHRIQGISDEFVPPLLELQNLDRIVQVSDGDSILMAQKLSCQLGLAVGISSGANLIGAILLQEELGMESVVTTVFSDCNKKYLGTDLMNPEPVKSHYLTPEIKLLSYKAIGRLNHPVGDPSIAAN